MHRGSQTSKASQASGPAGDRRGPGEVHHGSGQEHRCGQLRISLGCLEASQASEAGGVRGWGWGSGVHHGLGQEHRWGQLRTSDSMPGIWNSIHSPKREWDRGTTCE